MLASMALQGPSQSRGEPAFDLTRHDLLSVDTTAIRWTELRMYVGGVEAEFLYGIRDVAPEECRAAALIGMVRLRNYYRQEQGSEPVTLRMDFQCGLLYRGGVRYDGVYARMEVRDVETGEPLYKGDRLGLP